ncbi:hypothetical protein MK280_07620 [Myxococcota bacterium]|nr:hypothetical protein [Myxococcota bacterium]
MAKTLKFLGLALTLIWALNPNGTWASDPEEVVIASGERGGFYQAVGRALRVVLSHDDGLPTEVKSTAGSMANLEALNDPKNPVNVALTQADALQRFLAQHPEFKERYTQLADVGKECAFLITRRGDGIRSLDALAQAGQGRAIALGEVGTGAAVTWSQMVALKPSLSAIRPESIGLIEALLAMGPAAPVQDAPIAMMIVQRPMAVATPLEVVLRNTNDYSLVPILKADLEGSGDPSGAPDYNYEKVVVGLARDHQTSVDTICTRGLILASPEKLSPETIQIVDDAVLTSLRYLMPGSR